MLLLSCNRINQAVTSIFFFFFSSSFFLIIPCYYIRDFRASHLLDCVRLGYSCNQPNTFAQQKKNSSIPATAQPHHPLYTPPPYKTFNLFSTLYLLNQKAKWFVALQQLTPARSISCRPFRKQQQKSKGGRKEKRTTRRREKNLLENH